MPGGNVLGSLHVTVALQIDFACPRTVRLYETCVTTIAARAFLPIAAFCLIMDFLPNIGRAQARIPTRSVACDPAHRR
jgi:hypothetical protein